MLPRGAPLPKLRDALAGLYVSPESAQSFVGDLRLEATRLHLRGTAKEIWDSILAEADKQRRMGDVLLKALEEYPEAVALRELERLLSRRRR